MTAYFKNK